MTKVVRYTKAMSENGITEEDFAEMRKRGWSYLKEEDGLVYLQRPARHDEAGWYGADVGADSVEHARHIDSAKDFSLRSYIGGVSKSRRSPDHPGLSFLLLGTDGDQAVGMNVNADGRVSQYFHRKVKQNNRGAHFDLDGLGRIYLAECSAPITREQAAPMFAVRRMLNECTGDDPYAQGMRAGLQAALSVINGEAGKPLGEGATSLGA